MSAVKVTAQDVNKLRTQTGAGMMDCKKALEEAAGDHEKAIEWLRKRGQKLSDKRADREAKEGAVIALVNADHTKGIVVNVGCETDFVGKNEKFVAFAHEIADIALANFPPSLEALLELPYSEGVSIKDKVAEQVGVIGEKISVSKYAFMEAAMVVPYIHMGNRLGVLLALNKNSEQFVDAGKDVAMQIAAMNPIAVNKEGVNATTIQKEIEIGMEVARNEGKPEAMLEKIAQGKLQKFFQDNTLVNQKFVKDGNVTVAQYLKTVDKQLEALAFYRITLA
jgi:elongation factor Ts